MAIGRTISFDVNMFHSTHYLHPLIMRLISKAVLPLLMVLFIGNLNGDEPRHVSLVSLIATPEKFDGMYVNVQGVAYFDSKHYINAIFLTREDKIRGNASNAVFLYFLPTLGNMDRLNGKFVTAQGKFSSANKGHLNVFSACLVDVDHLEAVKGRVGE
jgi:hypothetical protein